MEVFALLHSHFAANPDQWCPKVVIAKGCLLCPSVPTRVLSTCTSQSILKKCLSIIMPDAGVKKLNHGWTVKGIGTPGSSAWEWGASAPCPGNRTTASWCCAHWVSFEVRFLVSDGLHLRPTTSCRTWRHMSLKVSATCQHCRILYSNAEQISQDLLGCPEKSAVFAVRPPWMNDFLSLFSDKMGKLNGRDSELCPQRLLWEPGGKGSAGAGLHQSVLLVKCSSGTSKLASDKRVIRQV